MLEDDLKLSSDEDDNEQVNTCDISAYNLKKLFPQLNVIACWFTGFASKAFWGAAESISLNLAYA